MAVTSKHYTTSASNDSSVGSTDWQDITAGFVKITVSDSEPDDPQEGDIWIGIS